MPVLCNFRFNYGFWKPSKEGKLYSHWFKISSQNCIGPSKYVHWQDFSHRCRTLPVSIDHMLLTPPLLCFVLMATVAKPGLTYRVDNHFRLQLLGLVKPDYEKNSFSVFSLLQGTGLGFHLLNWKRQFVTSLAAGESSKGKPHRKVWEII